eukprot:g60587.t1
MQRPTDFFAFEVTEAFAEKNALASKVASLYLRFEVPPWMKYLRPDHSSYLFSAYGWSVSCYSVVFRQWGSAPPSMLNLFPLIKTELEQLHKGFVKKEVKKGDVLHAPSFGGEHHDDGMTITAAEDTTILTGDGDKMKQILKKHPQLGEAIANVCGKPISLQLKDIPLFAEVQVAHLQQLAAMCVVRKVQEGMTICAEGDAADGFYYIISGRVQVSVKSGKEEVFMSVLGAKDWFGEIALLEETTRTATVRTIADCLVVYLTKESFNTFLDLAPGLRESQAFVSLVSRRTGNHLKSIPLFHGLKTKKTQIGPMDHFDEKKLQLLGELFRWRELKPGEAIWKVGDLQQAFYVVVKGSLTMNTTDEKGKDVTLATFKLHEWFGEASLLNIEDGRWTSTVTADEDCLLLELKSSHFQSFQQIAPDICSVVRTRLGATTGKHLRTIPFFAQVRENRPWSKLDLLGDLFTFEVYDAKKTIVQQGERGTKFYVLVSGECEVSIQEPGKKDHQHITNMKKGDWFGEIALMRDTPRTATVTATTDVVLVTINAEKFHRFLDIAPELTEPFEMMLDIRTARMLKNIDIFARVRENRPWSKLEVIGSLFDYLHVDANTIVYDAEETADLFYVIIKGDVELTDANTGNVRKQGEKTTLSFPQCVEGNNRMETCKTLTNCLFATMDRDLFPRLIGIAPEILQHFGKEELQLQQMRKSIQVIADDLKDKRAQTMPSKKRSIIRSRRSSPNLLTTPEGAKMAGHERTQSHSESSLSSLAKSTQATDLRSFSPNLVIPFPADGNEGDSPESTPPSQSNDFASASTVLPTLDRQPTPSIERQMAPLPSMELELSVSKTVITEAAPQHHDNPHDPYQDLEAWQRLPEFQTMIGNKTEKPEDKTENPAAPAPVQQPDKTEASSEPQTDKDSTPQPAPAAPSSDSAATPEPHPAS